MYVCMYVSCMYVCKVHQALGLITLHACETVAESAILKKWRKKLVLFSVATFLIYYLKMLDLISCATNISIVHCGNPKGCIAIFRLAS